MKSLPLGSWVAIRSLSSEDFRPGREWIHFSLTGRHVLETLHPGESGASLKIEFTLREEKEGYHFCPTKKLPDGTPQEGWRVDIAISGSAELVLTVHYSHRHLVTIFERVTRGREDA